MKMALITLKVPCATNFMLPLFSWHLLWQTHQKREKYFFCFVFCLPCYFWQRAPRPPRSVTPSKARVTSLLVSVLHTQASHILTQLVIINYFFTQLTFSLNAFLQRGTLAVWCPSVTSLDFVVLTREGSKEKVCFNETVFSVVESFFSGREGGWINHAVSVCSTGVPDGKWWSDYGRSTGSSV